MIISRRSYFTIRFVYKLLFKVITVFYALATDIFSTQVFRNDVNIIRELTRISATVTGQSVVLDNVIARNGHSVQP